MTVRRTQQETSILYFVTFTCIDWLDLIQQTDLYEFVIKQLNICHQIGYFISGFVIMPNHIHLMIYVPKNGNLQKRIANMKRFMSYEIIKRLSNTQHLTMLNQLHKHVNNTDLFKGQRHDVFIKSFDAKPIYFTKFAEQKITYMHENPVKGKWQLSDSYINYQWSSVAYYELNHDAFHFITHYMNLV
jgi:REP element-mobilizing transposase RayT